ncbi:hypothetical protein LAT45_22655, partial [Vibrio harveyi]
DKALAEMLGLFLLRYYFGLRPTSPIECKSRRSATYLETQSPDWVLSFLEYDSLFLGNEPAKVSGNLQFLPTSLP